MSSIHSLDYNLKILFVHNVFSLNHGSEMSFCEFPKSFVSWPSAKQRPISFVESIYFWTHFVIHLLSLPLSSLVPKSQTQRLKQSCDIVLYVLKNSRKVLVWSSFAKPLLMFAVAVSSIFKLLSDILQKLSNIFHLTFLPIMNVRLTILHNDRNLSFSGIVNKIYLSFAEI